MRYLVPVIFFLSALSLHGARQTANQKPPGAVPDVPTVAFCDLLKKPQAYSGKVIRTHAVFSRRGEEVTEFYCPACLESGGVDFDLDEGYDTCTKPTADEKITRHPTVNVTLTGRFVMAGPGEGFGHMGQWRYKLVVGCIEKADILSKHELAPDRLPTEIRRRASCL